MWHLLIVSHRSFWRTRIRLSFRVIRIVFSNVHLVFLGLIGVLSVLTLLNLTFRVKCRVHFWGCWSGRYDDEVVVFAVVFLTAHLRSIIYHLFAWTFLQFMVLLLRLLRNNISISLFLAHLITLRNWVSLVLLRLLSWHVGTIFRRVRRRLITFIITWLKLASSAFVGVPIIVIIVLLFLIRLLILFILRINLIFGTAISATNGWWLATMALIKAIVDAIWVWVLVSLSVAGGVGGIHIRALLLLVPMVLILIVFTLTSVSWVLLVGVLETIAIILHVTISLIILVIIKVTHSVILVKVFIGWVHMALRRPMRPLIPTIVQMLMRVRHSALDEGALLLLVFIVKIVALILRWLHGLKVSHVLIGSVAALTLWCTTRSAAPVWRTLIHIHLHLILLCLTLFTLEVGLGVGIEVSGAVRIILSILLLVHIYTSTK